MKWSTIREKYPDRWVLVEALSAKSLERQRHIEEMSVLSEYNDTKEAWNAYKKHHLTEPSREYYIFHTSNEVLEVLEQPFTGVRGRP
jgi:hypothetical protein